MKVWARGARCSRPPPPRCSSRPAARPAAAAPPAGSGSGSGTSGLTAPQANTAVPTSVGKGEGQLNLIAWEGYAQPQWVKPFEQATGCQVSAKYAGSSSEMVSLMANGGGGQYDMVSASGDADLRLIYGGDVKPVNINLVPQWKNFHPFLQNPPFNTIGGKHYGVSLQFGPNVLLYSKKAFPSAPTSWSVLYNKKYAGEVTVPNNPIQIADAALYLSKTQPSLGITDPYELTQPQFNATVNLLKQQKPLIKKYWDLASQEISAVPERHHGGRRGLAVPDQHAGGGGREGRRHHPGPGRDRLGRHLDAGHQSAAPQLRLQVDAVGDDPQGPGAAGGLLRRDPGQQAGLPDHGPAPEGLVRRLPRERAGGLLPDHQVLEDPLAQCGNGKNDCVPFQQWVTAWTQITG